jgi:hypothetical protein
MINHTSIKEKFEKAYNRVPSVFSSNEFCNQLRSLGVSEQTIGLQYHLNFLMERTERITRRTFGKTTGKEPKVNLQPVIEVKKDSKADAIKAAIELLKSTGHKIYKITTEEL